MKRGYEFRGILFIIVMFADDFNIVGNKIDRVEPNTKLANEIEVSTCLHFLHKCCINDYIQLMTINLTNEEEGKPTL